ncbi:MAG TPA: ABC transporter permease [Spirochaetia bacterium]|nr:ABC transporter permease [Spirochaetia bacterium]
MARERNEATGEWLHAGRSAASMYGNFFYWLFREPFPVRQLGNQIVLVMLDAVAVNTVTAVVIGLIMAWTAGWNGLKFSVVNWAGAATVYLLLSEAVTMFGGLIFAAKIGTAFTVEIGSMQMNGQLDALRLMAVEPVQHIVIPRVLSSVICLVFLNMISQGAAIVAAMIAVRWWFDVSFTIFLQHVFQILRYPILTNSYIRSAIMAFFVSINACGLGFHFKGGAVELGRTTTKSIVLNFIFVISIDCLYGVMDQLTGWSSI